MRVYSGFSKKMKIAMKTASLGGFFVATYIMKAELLPVRLSINIRGNEKLKKKLRKKVRFL